MEKEIWAENHIVLRSRERLRLEDRGLRQKIAKCQSSNDKAERLRLRLRLRLRRYTKQKEERGYLKELNKRNKPNKRDKQDESNELIADN